jgi:hypothetical protein
MVWKNLAENEYESTLLNPPTREDRLNTMNRNFLCNIKMTMIQILVRSTSAFDTRCRYASFTAGLASIVFNYYPLIAAL